MPAVTDDRGFNQIFEQSPGNLIRLERRADWIIENMKPTAQKTVLEVGCGTGFLAYQIAKKTGMQVLGSDLCIPFIKEANDNYKLPNLSFQVLDFNEAAAKMHSKFDYIIGNGILHHLYYNLQEVFAVFKKNLNDGGKIIFMEPNIFNPYVWLIFKNKPLRQWAKLEPDEMAFSKPFIACLLKDFGFNDIKVTYKDFLLPGIPERLIKPSIFIGNYLEQTPLRTISQSILISASLP